MTDEIIQEVWRAKTQIAKDCRYDIDALAAELQRRQKESGREIVNLSKDNLVLATHQHPTTEY